MIFLIRTDLSLTAQTVEAALVRTAEWKCSSCWELNSCSSGHYFSLSSPTVPNTISLREEILGAHLPSCLSQSASKLPVLALYNLEKEIVQTCYYTLWEKARKSSPQLKAFPSRSFNFMLPWALFPGFLFSLQANVDNLPLPWNLRILCPSAVGSGD